MIETWRPLMVAAALNVTVGVAAATAQTVIIRNAPPGSAVELVLNADTIATGKVDEGGYATLPVSLSKHVNKTETDAQIFVDVCPDVRRVLIAERTIQPPVADVGCARRDMGGLFLLRGVSTLLIDVGGPSPTLRLRQGSVSLGPPRTWSTSPTGIVIFGGGAYTSISDAKLRACGDVDPCSGEAAGFGYTAGIGYWVSPFIGAEAAYIRPAEMKADGSGPAFRFNSGLKANVFTAMGKVGAPLGAVRVYGQVGASYTDASFTTTQTIDDTTITIDGVTQTIPGGRQTYQLTTRGWGWAFGGGLEAWLAAAFGIYGEVNWIAMKGKPTDNGDGELDDKLLSIVAGGRLRFGR